MRFHWYEHTVEGGGRRFYSDYKSTTDLPDVMGVSFGILFAGFAKMRDRYGNVYMAASLGLEESPELWGDFSFSGMEFEAYASYPGNRWKQQVWTESALRNIIEGPSFTLGYVLPDRAENIDIWDSGNLWTYSGNSVGLGANVSFGITEWQQKDDLFAWDWIDQKIPGYDQSVLTQDGITPCPGCDYTPNNCGCE
jgi:hypothetical protein